MTDEKDQDALADEWAAALEEQENAADEPENPEVPATQPAAQPDVQPDVQPAAQPKAPASAPEESEDERLAAEWAAALADDEQTAITEKKEQSAFSSKAQAASFVDMTDEAKAPRADSNRKELDFILDIPLDISAELGRARLLINELLQLGQGSVVELNKLAGEPLEVYVNGKIIARGEAVVINEKFGVRLTDIISPIERVKQLG